MFIEKEVLSHHGCLKKLKFFTPWSLKKKSEQEQELPSQPGRRHLKLFFFSFLLHFCEVAHLLSFGSIALVLMVSVVNNLRF